MVVEGRVILNFYTKVDLTKEEVKILKDNYLISKGEKIFNSIDAKLDLDFNTLDLDSYEIFIEE